LAATPPSVPELGEGRMKAFGSDGEHRHLVALRRQIGAERVDGGGLAGAGRAGDAEPHRLAGERQQLLHQAMCLAAVIGALALDQRDGAREPRTVAGADAASKGGAVGCGRSHARNLRSPRRHR
jgi:hypothetical protein